MDLIRRQPLAFRLRDFGAQMRAIRESLGLSQQAVQKALDMDAKTIRRVEGGKASQMRTVRSLLDLYESRGADPSRRPALFALVRPVERPEWLHAYDANLSEAYIDYVIMETFAETVTNYESLFLPGLVQTRDYAEAAIAGALPAAPVELIRHLVDVRMHRQSAVSTANPPMVTAVVDEAAIRRVVGGTDVMRAQLKKLLDSPPNVVIRVIPFWVGAHPGMSGSFSLMTFRDPDFSPVVYIDSMAGDLLYEDALHVERYNDMFRELEAVTLSAEESARLVADAVKRIK